MSTRASIPWEAPRSGRFTIDRWDIDLPRTALLLVDVQQGYVDPGLGIGPYLKEQHPEIYRYYYSRLGETALPAISRLVSLFHSKGLEVIYTRMGLQLPKGRDVPPWSWKAAQAGEPTTDLFAKESAEYQIVPQVAPLDHELVLDKNSASPFPSTPVDQLLRNMGIENLVIVGRLTNVAVESTARSAGDRGYNPMVVSDGCVAFSQRDHDDTLATASWWTVKEAEEVVELLGALPG